MPFDLSRKNYEILECANMLLLIFLLLLFWWVGVERGLSLVNVFLTFLVKRLAFSIFLHISCFIQDFILI